MFHLSVLGLSSTIAAVCMTTFLAAPAPASAGAYCFNDPQSNSKLCDYDSMEQCRASSSGRGGTCFRDPWQSSADEPFSQVTNGAGDRAVQRRAHASQSRKY